MSKTTILFIRHGQSEGNTLGVFTGHSGYPLTELGHKQAEMTGEYIRRNYAVDGVYCSDLPRAFQTAEHIANKFALPVITDCRLREINAGQWENKQFDELPELFPEAYAVWMKDLICARCTGGESVVEISERATEALQDIAIANPGKCIVVVAHATTLRAALCKISGGTREIMNALGWGSNCGINVLSYENGNLNVESVNYSEHLEGYSTALPSSV